jgi:hypothetical protein
VTPPEDLHEWISFADPDEDRTWIFDVTFLTSRWSCIFGRGCKGVLTEDYSEAVQGCCSYGAHFTGPDDVAHTEAMAERLSPSQWQFRDDGLENGVVEVNEHGETTTRLVDDACVFLNRPGFDGDGLGCAFHHAAVANGERHMDWMPEVCWQLPLRRIDETDDNGHVTSTVREWKRRDWGEGGLEFHWWCTEEPEAFAGHRPVYEELGDELREMVGDEPYRIVVEHLRDRTARKGTEVFLPHPAVRRTSPTA